MEFTETAWKTQGTVGLYEVGKVDLDQMIEKIGNLREGESGRFGFGRKVILNENGNCVHEMQIRASSPNRVDVHRAGFSPFNKHRIFKSLPKLRKWLIKWEKKELKGGN